MNTERQLECFVELLKHESIYKKIGFSEHYPPIIIGFGFSMLGVADRYRLDEPYKDLMEVSAKDLISNHIDELQDALIKKYNNVYCTKPHIGNFVPELCTYVKSHRMFKKMVSGLLKMQRDDLFEEKIYLRKVKGLFTGEEHPMVTFVRAIDVIESTKGTAEYKASTLRKREIWKYLRMGYSALDKSDWQNRIELL